MKVLALAVVVLFGVSLVEGRAVRDAKSDLIAKGQSLIKQADEAVQKLTGAQKVQEASIVKVEEARIKQLVAELETATLPTAVTRIEGELNRAEQKLAFEIQKINREAKPVVTRDVKSALIAKGNRLIQEADAAFQKLTGAQKAAEAAVVKSEEAAVKKLIADLEATAATELAIITKIEAELNRAEQKLAAEVQKLEKEAKPVVTRDLKSTLIAKGQKLVQDADAAFKKLSTAQKAAEAAVVKSEEAAVKKFIAELEATTDEAALKKIEAELNAAEKKLAAEVAKLEKEVVVVPPKPVTRDLKSDLIAKGNALIKQADAAVQTLTGLQKAAEAAIVRAEEGAIRRLISELEVATEETAVRRIEAELTRAEARLAAEVAKITKTPVGPVVGPGPVDLKATLIARGESLIKQADEAVQKLRGQSKVAEAAIVKAEEEAITKLTTELKAATEEAAIRRIEGELNRAEQKLAQEIAKINRISTPIIDRDLKSDLIAKGQDLIKQADAAVQKLTGVQKVTEAAIVRAEENAIRRLITELEAATEEPAIRRIEAELTRAEARLAAEVAKISTPATPTGDLKQSLITKGQDLIKQADAAVQTLTGAQKVAEAAIVRAEENAIRRLITELEAATEETAVRRIEAELTRAEARLAAEVAKITKTPVGPVVPANPTDLKATLIARGESLIKQADEAVQKLRGQSKVAEAAIVKAEEEAITKLITELNAATEEAAIRRIEGELNRAEQKLAQEIAKINRIATPIIARDAKSDLIAKGQSLIKQADEAVQKLTGAQKVQEASIVKVEEARIKQLVAELETATLPTAVTRIEGELNRAEQKLAFEIQKINREAKPVAIPL